MPEFIATMKYIRENDGQFPPVTFPTENQIGANTLRGPVDHIAIQMHEQIVKNRLFNRNDMDIIVVLVDEYLLYADPAVANELDLRLFIRASYDTRREARNWIAEGINQQHYVYEPGLTMQDG